MFDRRLVENFNWGLLGITIVLAGIGIGTLYSAVTAGPDASLGNLYAKQLVWYGVGCVMMIVCFLFNYRILERWSMPIYLFCVGLLIYVLLFGKSAGGSTRWVSLGPASLQPSEVAKIAVIIYLAGYYSKCITTEGLVLKELVRPLVVVMIPFMLIVKQPDLGTGLLIVFIAAVMTVFVKIERRSFLYIVVSAMVCAPMVWFFLKPYQKQRMLTFLNPERDPLGTGYHIIQSKIAIGSGMVFGKGFLKGTQNALAFLPEQQTDFIFSVLSEEWGLLGATLVLLLFALLLITGLNIANSCREPFGVLLAVGVTSLIFFEIFVNIGMVMGLLPVVGVPLPFISYGGSSIISKMICIGLLLNISMRRFLIK